MDEGLPSVSILIFFIILIMDVLVHGFGVALGHVREEEIEKKVLENKEQLSAKILKAIKDDARLIKCIQYFNIVVNMILGGIVVINISGAFVSAMDKNMTTTWYSHGVIYLCTGLIISFLRVEFYSSLWGSPGQFSIF